MNKSILWLLTLLTLGYLAGCSDSDVSQTSLLPLHYSQQAPDLIDVCRYDALDQAADKDAFDLAAAVGKAGETLGAALDADTRTRVLIRAQAAEGETQKYTDSWLTKVAATTGIRTVMARLDAAYESSLFALDDSALLAMPFRFMAIPDGVSMIHICMVDPVAYLRQFTSVSREVRNQLNEAVAHYETIIQNAFPDAYFDPQRQPETPESPESVASLISLGEINADMDTVSSALENGTFYYNDIAFGTGLDVFGDNDGTDDADDIYLLYEDPANHPSIEMRGFIPFKPTFAGLKGSTDQVPNLSNTMEYLVQKSFIHIYDGADRRQVYDVNGNTVYQLQVFHAYMDPMMITSGVSHFAAVPMSVFISEHNGRVSVEMQNPTFKFIRYYGHITSETMSNLRQAWNNADPVNKVVWPDTDVEGLGEISEETAREVFDAATAAF